MPKEKLGQILVRRGVLTDKQLAEALARQSDENALIGDTLVGLGFIRPADLADALSEQHGLPFVDLEEKEADLQLVMLLPEAFCRQHSLAPFEIAEGRLSVAMVAPDDLWAISEIELLTGYPVQPCVALRPAIHRVLDRCFDRSLLTRQTIIDMRMEELKKTGKVESVDLLAVDAVDASDVPVVRLANSIIRAGIDGNASDIHLEPQHPEMRVRNRIDGVLYETTRIPKHIESALVARLKVMADLDITERRHPQDGHISFNNRDRSFDLRVSTMPSVLGEKIVIRILEKQPDMFRIGRLGFSDRQRAIIGRFLGHPHGMILVTGPTGSGKSTSLYAMLQKLNTSETNIITLEDPVENQVQGMTQINVDPNFGMSFASGLKYILRQDPDVIMVGEIRDGETARIAIQAALTGHLLLSTLHTNDAAGAVTRLIDLGVQPFLMASSLIGVVAQRLLRRVCPSCGDPFEPGQELREEFRAYADDLEGAQLRKGEGCEQCFETGYRGRCAVFEVMPVSASLVKLIERSAAINEIEAQAIDEGMETLVQAAVRLAASGATTLDEVRQRVLVWEDLKRNREPALAGVEA